MADSVAAGRSAIHRTNLGGLSEAALTVPAGHGTIRRALPRRLIQAADRIAASAAIDDTVLGAFASFTLSVTARRQAILRACAPIFAGFIEAAHAVAARPAIHRTLFVRRGRRTETVAARGQTRRIHSSCNAEASLAVLSDRTRVIIFAEFSIIARGMSAFTGIA